MWIRIRNTASSDQLWEALTLMLGVWPVLVVQAVVDPESAGAPHLTQRLQHHVPDTVGALTQASEQASH